MIAPMKRIGVQRWYAVARRHSTLLWSVLLAICAGIYVIQARGDFASAATLVTRANPGWILALIVTQLLALAVAGQTYRSVLRRLGHRLRLRSLVELHLQRKVIGTITPGGGPASVYVFVRGLDRYAVSSDDALFTTGLRSFAGYASFVTLLLPVLYFARPSGMMLAGAFTVIGLFLLTTGLLVLLLQHEPSARAVERRLPTRIGDAFQRVRGHGLASVDLMAPIALSLIGHLASVGTLYAAHLATGYTPSLVTVLVSYTVATVFVSLSPVFQGIGVVEMTLAVTLQQFGVPAGAAIGATLLYRIATVWFPLLLGLGAHAGRRFAGIAPMIRSLPTPAKLLSGTRRVATQVSGARPVLPGRSVGFIGIAGLVACVVLISEALDSVVMTLQMSWLTLVVLLFQFAS